MKKSTKGFSLIELLIVVAIILIIAAIAVPNLLRSRIAANQASAASTLRTLNTCEVSYASTYGIGYSSDLANLGPAASTGATSTAAGLVDSLLAVDPATKTGYTFSYVQGSVANGVTNAYTINGDPLSANTGTNHYYTDQTMVIRFNTTAAAGAGDAPLGN